MDKRKTIDVNSDQGLFKVPAKPIKTKGSEEEARRRWKSQHMSVKLHTSTAKNIDGKAESLRPKRLSKMMSDTDIHREQPPGFLYGISLEDLIERNKNKEIPVPEFLLQVYKYLKDSNGFMEEGIFRISPFGGIVDEVKWALDKGISVNFKMTKGFNNHVASGLLKMWLRSMPEPLIPFDLYDRILELHEHQEDIIMFTDLLSGVLHKLPPANKITLQVLIRLLYEVKQRCTENKMNSTNLAMVFAPCVMRVKNPRENPMREFSDIPKAIAALAAMIDFYTMLFIDELPPIILEQLESTEHSSASEGLVLPVIPPEQAPPASSEEKPIDDQSGADVLRQYLQNGFALPDRLKPLAQQEGVVENRRSSITETEDNSFSIDSPLRPQARSPVPSRALHPAEIPHSQKRASVILKGIADLFTPKKDATTDQKKRNRVSFWFTSGEDEVPKQPTGLAQKRPDARASVAVDSDRVISNVPNARGGAPTQSRVNPKAKSKTMSFLVSAFH